MKKIPVWIAFLFLVFNGSTFVEADATLMSLEEILRMAYKKNPSLQEARHRFSSEEALIRAKMFPDSPVLSTQKLHRNQTTIYRGLSQKIRFPVKYFLSARAQKSLARSWQSQWQWEKWRLREKVVNLYYGIYSLQKMILLTQANRDVVREFARVAEKKYAAGKTNQSDSMKAHFELTQMELKLIQMEEEEYALQVQLRAVLNNLKFPSLRFFKKELSVPRFEEHKVQKPLQELTHLLQKSSPQLQKEQYLLDKTKWENSLAQWEFAPDVEWKYQEQVSGQPQDSYIQSIHLHFPLWFFPQRSKISSHVSRKKMQTYRLESTQKHLLTEVLRLRKRTRLGAKTLQIYKTSLIPQSLGAYHSSKAAYKANKSSFLDFIDSERSLLRAKIGFYKALRDYVQSLCALELALGFKVSNIDSLRSQEEVSYGI